jgi:hypothetical protein
VDDAGTVGLESAMIGAPCVMRSEDFCLRNEALLFTERAESCLQLCRSVVSERDACSRRQVIIGG